MKTSVDSVLFKGIINKEFRCTYILQYTDEGNYPTILAKPNGRVAIYPSYLFIVSEGFNKPQMCIGSQKFFQFVTLLKKGVDVISENLYDIFPNINKIEFEIDSRTLDRFNTEKAIGTAGMSITPAVWSDPNNQCFPGIRISSVENPGGVIIPLEDAIAMCQLLSTFDAPGYAIALLRLLGKLE